MAIHDLNNTSASTTSESVAVTKYDVVNDVIVYDHDYDFSRYRAYEKYGYGYGIEIGDAGYLNESIPELRNALEGLNILEVSVKEPSNVTKSPIETGVYVNDFKVRLPRTISIKGICDNLRGEIETVKDTRFDMSDSKIGKIPIVGGAVSSVVNGIVNEVAGYEYETQQRILTVAKKVYKKIHDMYTSTKRMKDVENMPKTWTISTKGAVYPNMILEEVEQLNDAEHLMVIPVTLVFTELIMPGLNRNAILASDEQDQDLVMSGQLKKGSWKDRADGFFSDVGDWWNNL